MEDRTLPSAGQWLAVFEGISPGNTLDEQTQLGQGLLQGAGIATQNVQIVNALDLTGTFVVQTPTDVDQATVTAELQGVTGFDFVQSFDEPDGSFAPLDAIGNNNAGSSGTAFFTQGETSLVAFGNTAVLAYYDSGSAASGNSYTGFSQSTNTNVATPTFTDFGAPPSGPNGDGGDPVLARNNTTGRIYMSTLQFSGSGVNVYRSDTNGASWQAPVQGAPGKTFGLQDKPWITVDNFAGTGNGNVYLAERDFGQGGIYFFRSTDNGNTFGPSGGTFIASGGQGAYVTVGADHSVYVFWYAGSTLQMRRSTNQGASFGATVTVASGLLTTTNGDLGLVGQDNGETTNRAIRTNSFVQVAVNPINPANLYATYTNDGSGVDKADVFMVTSTNAGATWSSPIKVNDDATTTDQWHPTIAVTPDGNHVGIFYYSRQDDTNTTDGDPANNQFRFYGRIGTISGATVSFGQSFAVSDVATKPEVGRDTAINPTFMSDYNQVVATANAFHVAWSDNRTLVPNGGNRLDPNIQYQVITLPSIVSTTPAVGGRVSGATTTFTVRVTEPITLSSVQASDFKVNGIAASSAAYDGNTTITFFFATSPITAAQGPQTMHIDAGAFTRANDGAPTAVFDGTFYFDVPQLAVSSTSPSSGSTYTLGTPFTVFFNEPIDPASLQASDLVVSGFPGATVTGVTLAPNHQNATFTITGTGEGTMTASIAAGAINDQFGNPGAAFTASYPIDIASIGWPIPFTTQAPPGSLIYDPTTTGAITSTNDTDTFTFGPIDAPQTITVIATPTAGSFLLPSIKLLSGGTTTLATATASGPNQKAIIQTFLVPTSGIGAPLYSVTVSGASFSTGGYTLQIILNSAEEVENDGAGTNDSRATAQDINGSFINLQTLGGTADRGAVEGHVGPAELITNGNFETHDFTGWTLSSFPQNSWLINDGTIHPSGASFQFFQPISGTSDAMSNNASGTTFNISQNFQAPTVVGRAILSWDDRLFTSGSWSDPNQEFRVQILTPGVFPTLLATVFSTNAGDPISQPGPNHRSFDITSVLQAHLGQQLMLRFEEADGTTFISTTLDNVSLQVSPDATGADSDYYAFTGTAGKRIDLALAQPGYVPAATTFSSTRTDLTTSPATTPQQVVYGDLNGDGKLDMVSANGVANSAGTIAVRLGNGDGTFGTASLYSTGGLFTRFLDLGDIDGDGNLDVVVSNDDSNGVSRLLGNGDGTFGSAFSFSVGSDPEGLMLADLNKDGRADAVVANSNSGNISVLLGQANGLFSVSSVSLFTTGPFSIALGDVNNDGTLDIATANSTSGTSSILTGNGSGGFNLIAQLSMATTPRGVVLADVNRDGNLDLVTVNQGANNIAVRLGNGNGTFGNIATFATGGTQPNALAAGDVNGDGIIDLAVSNAGSSNVSVLQGVGDGTFSTAMLFATNGVPNGVALADLNGDGLDDLSTADAGIAGNGSISLRMNTTPGATIQLIDSAGNVLAIGAAGAANYQRGLSFVPTVTGTYYARVFSSAVTNYDLIVTRNSRFETEVNDARGAAADITGTRGVLGALASTSDVDFYKITIPAQRAIQLQTSTPDDGIFEVANTLNPQLQVFNASGTLIASGTVLGDGRNESMSGLLNAGTYYVRVGSQNNTKGEYFLALNLGPIAGNDSATTNEDTAVQIDVLANDSDDDGITSNPQITTAPTHGTAQLFNNGFRYTPAANFSGTDTFRYTVRDSNNLSATAQVTINVVAVADAPTLTAPAAVSGTENAAIPLNLAAALVDTDGSESLSIEISGVPLTGTLSAGVNNGGGVWTLTAAQLAGLTLTLPDNLPGDAPFDLTITVTSSEQSNGSTASTMATTAVTVNNVAPVITAVSPDTSIDENDVYTLTGTFHDDGIADTHTVVIDWGTGEGTTTLTTADLMNLGNGDWSFSASHQYLDDNPMNTAADVYAISVSVTDDDGASDSTATSVTVNNVAPSNLNIGLDQNVINENDVVTLTGSFADPGTLDTHTVVIHWGDGTADTTLDLAAGVASFSTAHQYLDDNPTGTGSDVNTISVTVTDDDTGSAAGSTDITVNNVAPSLAGLANSSPAAGGAFMGVDLVSISASFTDIGTLDTHTASINWGDGVTTSGVVTEAGGNGTVTGSHVYASGGVFTITVTLTDDDGGTSQSTTQATVGGVGLHDGQLQIIGTADRDLVHVMRRDGHLIVDLHFDADRDDDHDHHHGHDHDHNQSDDCDWDDEGEAHWDNDDEHDFDHDSMRLTFNVADVQSILIDVGAGNDVVHVGHHVTMPTTIIGGAGNDLLIANGGNDTIIDLSGCNHIHAGPGNDSVTVGDGDNSIGTDGGNDTITAGNGQNYIHLGDGSNAVSAGNGNNQIWSGGGTDFITVGNGANEIHAGGSADTVHAGNGNNRIYTDGGNDSITAGDGNNEVHAGNGNNTIILGNGNNRVFAGSGNDVITTGSGNDWIDAGGGNDVINAGDGDNDIDADDGDDQIITGSGRDRIDAGNGNDFIRAGAGNDIVDGGNGNDIIVGDDGDDLLIGGNGRDILVGGNGADRLVGNNDDDLLIGGRTAFDANAAALGAILAEWNSSRSYDTRVANIRGTGTGTRLNGSNFLVLTGANATVVDDAAADTLTGSNGTDWFFAESLDTVTDLHHGEDVN